MQKYGELLRTLLEKRGILNEEQADIFLNPNYERDFHDSFLMKDMKHACARIFQAIKENEKIIIYADYDCGKTVKFNICVGMKHLDIIILKFQTL